MAWETSNRRQRLPREWPELVRKVWDRDDGRCRWILPSGRRCPRRGADVDHRIPGDDHSLENLQLLCRHHHDKKTLSEAYAGRMNYREAKKAIRRPSESHPGYNGRRE